MSNDLTPFDFEVPRRLIAQQPLRQRADARLMLVDRGRQQIAHHHVRDLPHLLASGDRLVLNDTKVIAAQLAGRRTGTGGRWQGLFLEQSAEGDWVILCKTRGRLQPGEAITLEDREGRPGEKLRLCEKLDEGRWLAQPEADQPTDAILSRLGRVPLPPYIRGGNMVDADVANYQTVFAAKPGAIAAPTAGLHFTNELLKALATRGIPHSRVTLHVGLGTFRPIEAETLEDHRMHSEMGEISEEAAREINNTKSAGGRVVSVGTTVTRLLETAVRWAGDEGATGVTASQAAGVASDAAPGNILRAWRGATELFIRPPFEFRVIDALMTNFHFPRTTLLLLVQAFAGWELVTAAYRQAIAEEYRFYSYGDAMLIL